jgi:hypothetical protein
VRQSERDIYLNLDRVGVHAEHRRAAESGEHDDRDCKPRDTELAEECGRISEDFGELLN